MMSAMSYSLVTVALVATAYADPSPSLQLTECQIPLLKECTDWGGLSKHDAGCVAFARGGAKGDYDCHQCEPDVSTDTNPCDMQQCRSYCVDLYQPAQRNYCFQGCAKMNEVFLRNADSCLCGDETYPPTSAPTQVPSRWYDHDQFNVNFTALQDRIQVLTSVVARLDAIEANERTTTTKVSGLAQQLDTLQTEYTESINNLDTLNDDVQVSLDAQAARINSVVQDVSKVRQAIAAAVSSFPPQSDVLTPSSCGGADDCAPSVKSNGPDITLSAPGGKIIVSGAQCDDFDPCTDNTKLKTLRAALEALRNA